VNDRREPAYRPATAYVHGADGPVAIVPARVAAWLDRQVNLTRLRIEHRGFDPEVDSVLVGLRVAAMAWRETVGTRGTDSPCGAEPAAPSLQWMTTTDVAIGVGMTERGVRKAIAAGHLRASRDNRRWMVDLEDFEHFRAARRAA
jgi:hypothetical protein